jgi:hypothetical protein
VNQDPADPNRSHPRHKEMNVSANPPRDAELLDLKRQAFLLDQLNSEPGGKITQSQANKKITKSLQKELTIAVAIANDLRKGLAALGFLTENRHNRSVIYTITDAGRTWLVAHREHVPTPPPTCHC